MLISLLQIALLAYLGFAALIYFLQDHMIFQPSRDMLATPAAIGLRFDAVSIATSDGLRLDAWHVPAPQTSKAPMLALIFHGNAGNNSHRLDYLRMFHELGLASLIVDYRGYGRSNGTPSESGLYQDAAAAWHYVTSILGYPAGRIVIYGESLGGAVATQLAVARQPSALVLASTFTSLPDLASGIYPWLPVRLLARTKFDTLSRVSTLACPLLVIHSRNDEIIPFSHGERLYDAARPPKQFLHLAGGHNEGFVFSRAEWVRKLGDFLHALPAAHAAPAKLQ